jgi:hypothetical protein
MADTKTQKEPAKPAEGQELRVVAATLGTRELTDDEIRFRENDPYVQALTLAMGHANAHVPGTDVLHAAEVGVYRGRSLAILLEAGAKFKRSIKWTGFDTFEGLPPLSAKDLELAPPQAPYLKRVMFNDTTVREIKAYLEPLGLNDSLELAVGTLKDTLPAQPKRTYFFVNVSIKTYEGHMEALNYFYPRMMKGGVILFDDFFNRGAFPMAEIAIREFLMDKPEPIYSIFCSEGQSSFRRAFIVKG